MKKYTPIKMIRASRYKVCFDGLELEVRADVLCRMETLITENREWCDKGNGRLFRWGSNTAPAKAGGMCGIPMTPMTAIILRRWNVCTSTSSPNMTF